MLHELNEIYERRGEITRAQIEFAKAEMRALETLYPIKKASEEVRRPQYRTLESYLSINALSPNDLQGFD